MHHPSVHTILELGDAMLAALDDGDVEVFSGLLERRGKLVRRLAADLEADGLTQADRDALDAQGERMVEAMRTTRVGLGAAISAVSRFRTANRSYAQRQGVPMGRLNKSLHG
ncbi:MAG: hypothetical protein JJ896_12505 [Rhodothermales bacterium]|nr:hypothetical protein [Rhodothermales bacterium]MBO6780467.1 hypothetical protein [Rhodothermales bacterium]